MSIGGATGHPACANAALKAARPLKISQKHLPLIPRISSVSVVHSVAVSMLRLMCVEMLDSVGGAVGVSRDRRLRWRGRWAGTAAAGGGATGFGVAGGTGSAVVPLPECDVDGCGCGWLGSAVVPLPACVVDVCGPWTGSAVVPLPACVVDVCGCGWSVCGVVECWLCTLLWSSL